MYDPVDWGNCLGTCWAGSDDSSFDVQKRAVVSDEKKCGDGKGKNDQNYCWVEFGEVETYASQLFVPCDRV